MKRLLVVSALMITACSGQAVQPDPVYRETVLRHSRPQLDAERFDPQESDITLIEAFAMADAKAERKVANAPRNDRFIYKFWAAKRRILLRDFGITWSTPADLNPGLKYESYGQPALTELEVATIRGILITAVGAKDSTVTLWRWPDGTVFVNAVATSSHGGKAYRFRGHDASWTYSVEGQIVE